VAGEAALMAIVVAVPLLISPGSKHILDVKDVVLGLGVTLGLCSVVLTSLARGRISWATSRLNALVTGFLVWATMTLIYSEYRYATISEVGRLAANVGAYWLVVLCVRDAGQVRRLLGLAALAAFAVAFYAFMQKFGLDFWRWEAVAGRRFSFLGVDLWKWEAGTGRVFSFLGNATYLASYGVLVAPLLIAAAWPGREERDDPSNVPFWYSPVFSIILFVVAGMLLLALYFTVSLSPMIGLALGTMLAFGLALVRGGWRLLRAAIPRLLLLVLLLGAVGLVGYRYLPERQQRRVQSVLRLKDPVGEGRVMQWRAGYELFRERPLLGGGYGTFRIHSLERMAPIWYAELRKSTEKMFVPSYAHNEYIQVLAGTGLVGGLLFFALLAVSLSRVVRVALRHPERQWRHLGLAVSAALTAFLFQNFFGVTFRQPGAVTFFWLSLGLVTVAAARMPAAGGGDIDGPHTRDLRFGRVSGMGLAGLAVGLLAVVGVLCWLTIRPAKANLMVREAETLAKLGNHAEAAELADGAAQLNPWDLRAYYISAYCWGSLGDHEKAVAANKKALDLLPGNASVYYNLGVSYVELGRYDEARESFERAVELMPTNAMHHAGLAEVLLRQQEYDAALEHAKQAIRLTKRDPKAYALAADIEAKRGNLRPAAKYLRRATKIAPNEARLWRSLAGVLAGQRKPRKAASAAQQWLALEPHSSMAYDMIGSCKYNLAEYLAARENFERAVELDPAFHSARFKLAHTHLKLGQTAQARRELKYLADRPETPEGREAANLLQKLTRQPPARRDVR
jgi:tetratricopeptide (TPR) repeat protein/O-antigen ligase